LLDFLLSVILGFFFFAKYVTIYYSMNDTEIYKRNHPDLPPRILFVGRTRLILDCDDLHNQPRSQARSAYIESKRPSWNNTDLYQIGPTSHIFIEHPLSHLPLFLTPDAYLYFEHILKDVKDKNQDITIAINGWEGLTTDTLSFFALFATGLPYDYVYTAAVLQARTILMQGSMWSMFIRCEILQNESDTFFTKVYSRTNLGQMCRVLIGEVEETALDTSTGRVLWYFREWPRIEIGWTQMWPYLRHNQDQRPY